MDCTRRQDQPIETVTLTFYRFETLAARLWAFGMMAAARPGLARIPGLTFWKLCGAGSDAGFTPRLNMAVVAVLGVWPSRAAADEGLRAKNVLALYSKRASETWTVFLAPLSARGRWSGRTPFAGTEEPVAEGPVAVLTRATLRPRALSSFWPRVPDVSAAIGRDPEVVFKIGLGEVPFMNQITFSVWPDTDSMNRFARAGGAHAEAVRAVRAGRWFREELYARFRVVSDAGTWDGVRPLAALENEAAA